MYIRHSREPTILKGPTILKDELNRGIPYYELVAGQPGSQDRRLLVYQPVQRWEKVLVVRFGKAQSRAGLFYGEGVIQD